MLVAVGTECGSFLKLSGIDLVISLYSDYVCLHMLVKVCNGYFFTNHVYEKFSVDFIDILFCLGKTFNVNGDIYLFLFSLWRSEFLSWIVIVRLI